MKFENQYLTYDEYKKLGGNLSEMPFNSLEYRAEKQVDELTSNRFRKISNYPIELKLCVNELMTEIKKYNETGNKSSETVGSYSVNYDKQITSERQKSLNGIIKTYLSETKVNDIYVLYCGADDN
jgi:hypothetical protein